MTVQLAPDERRPPAHGGTLVVLTLLLLFLSSCAGTPPDAATPTRSPSRSVSQTFFVDCSRTTPGDGSEARPWNSPGDIAAHGAFGAGTSVLLRRGTRCTGQLTPSGDGTPEHPNRLGAYGEGERPVVDGAGSSDQTAAVQLIDVHDWTVEDLAVTNSAPQVDRTFRAGILVKNDVGGVLSGVLIRRNIVFGVTSSPGSWTADPHSYGGIAVIARPSTDGRPRSFTNIRITGNDVDDVGRSGIVVWSEDYARAYSTGVRVDGNTVRRAQGDSILLLGVDGGVVERNLSSDGGFLPACPGCVFTEYNTANAGIWPTRSRNIVIRHNEVTGENDSGGDGQGLDVDEQTENVVVEFNYSHDNHGGGILLCGAAAADVRFNVFRGNGGGEVTFSCPVQGDGIRIYNNVIDSRLGTGAAIVRTVQGQGVGQIVFANNIIANGSGGGYQWPAPATASGNYFSGTETGSEPAGAETERGDWPFIGAPLSVQGFETLSGYALRPNTAASTAVAPVINGGSSDFLGTTLTSGAEFRGVLRP